MAATRATDDGADHGTDQSADDSTVDSTHKGANNDMNKRTTAGAAGKEAASGATKVPEAPPNRHPDAE